MKVPVAALVALVSVALAVPTQVTGVAEPARIALSRRQLGLLRRQLKGGGGEGGGLKGKGGGATATKDELLNGACKKITLIFARASTEPGNMGTSMGANTCSGLKKAYSNNVACQGVGNPGGKGYSAGLMDNVQPKGTTSNAIAEATKMFTTADSKCPQSILVAGGYSQGTAVMMNTVSALPPKIKNKLVGVVLFGFTKNGQQNPSSKTNKKAEIRGGIPNYPKERVAVYCAESDGVCWGALSVTAGHFTYMANGDGPKSLAFLKGKIDAAKPGGASEGSEPAAEESAAPAGGLKGKMGKSPKGGKSSEGATEKPPKPEKPAKPEKPTKKPEPAETPAEDPPAAEEAAPEAAMRVMDSAPLFEQYLHSDMAFEEYQAY